MNKIILLCGPDGSGKSFLARQIMKKYPNHVYIHNAVTDDIKALHENTVKAAVLASEQHTVIIDRLHISEKVYGTLFRNGPSYNISIIEQMLNAQQHEVGNVIKLMCMVDKETSVGIHSSRKDKGEEMFSDNSKVWDMYNEETQKLPASWRVYNWKTDNIDLETFDVMKKKDEFAQSCELSSTRLKRMNEAEVDDPPWVKDPSLIKDEPLRWVDKNGNPGIAFV